jgi:hypothetical protein
MAILSLNNVKVISEPAGSDPSSPSAGQIYFNTTTNETMIYNGTEWIATQSTSAMTTIKAFDYTAGDQTWVVPANVKVIQAYIWGAGAGSGYHSTTLTGGSGGFTTGKIAVTSGETLTIMCGQRGETQSASMTYGGGGGINHGYNSSTGAGRSAIFRGGNSDISISTELATAGGGGGGGEDAGNNSPGGAGGGLTGQNGHGTGGTQSAKGTQSGNANADLSGDRCRGGHGSTKPASGGGGGGYYGGGAGAQDESGGGGSGYIGGMISGETTTGARAVPPGIYHPYYPQNPTGDASRKFGFGATTAAYHGQHGYVIIEYNG